MDTAPSLDDHAWCAALPKVELHLHLEGALPLDGLWELIRKYGGDPAVPDRAALERRFQYRDFPHFLSLWTWKNRFLREAEDFSWLAEQVARHLASQGHLHVEAFCSPPDFAGTGLDTGTILEALRRGLDRVPALRVALVPDLVRDSGPAAAARTLEEVAECRALGVVGIGLGGSEARFPARDFAAVFRRARALGLRTSCHAGEGAGAPSVREALEILEVDRIGHATRACEDPALVDRLLELGTGLECCPLSNLRTGIIPRLDAHPFLGWLRRGMRVCLNTDDPALFHTSLAGEIEEQFALGMTRAEAVTAVHNAVAMCWLDEAGRTALAAGIDARLAALELEAPDKPEEKA